MGRYGSQVVVCGLYVVEKLKPTRAACQVSKSSWRQTTEGPGLSCGIRATGEGRWRTRPLRPLGAALLPLHLLAVTLSLL